TARHNGQTGSNFALCDGHVKFLRNDQVSNGYDAVKSTDQARVSNASACGTGILGNGNGFAVTFSGI
ncbi:MAG: hypothetical protein M3Y56_16340, partial [Armatimonadota bacterium]|nr:hypothetical protein [Armatimonadota bacterium]